MAEIAAIGAGRMGRGIAQVFASAGHEVALIDFKVRDRAAANDLLAAAKTEIDGNLAFLQELGLLDEPRREAILGRIHGYGLTDGERALAEATVVFEGVPELLEAKRDAFERLSDLVSRDCLIASTTSTMLVEELAGFVSEPARFLNAHWLNPAYLIPLVEVSPGAATDEAHVARLFDLLKQVGKAPVRCAASPGYIVPRIQAVAMNEAARLVEEGVATAEDIDLAIRTGFGIRYATMGLVEFIDWGGVDILYYASNYLRDTLGADRFQSPDIVADMMTRGDKGLDAGKGFYNFTGTNAADFRAEKLTRFAGLLRHLDLLPKIV